MGLPIRATLIWHTAIQMLTIFIPLQQYATMKPLIKFHCIVKFYHFNSWAKLWMCFESHHDSNKSLFFCCLLLRRRMFCSFWFFVSSNNCWLFSYTEKNLIENGTHGQRARSYACRSAHAMEDIVMFQMRCVKSSTEIIYVYMHEEKRTVKHACASHINVMEIKWSFFLFCFKSANSCCVGVYLVD